MRWIACLAVVIHSATAHAEADGVLAASASAVAPPSAPSTAATARPALNQPPLGFVRTEGASFVIDGHPFTFVGANANVLHGEVERARHRETLAAVAEDGLKVARVWAFAEGPVNAGVWWRRDQLFRAGPDDYIEDAYRQLDAVVAESGQQGLRLILTLGNNWSDFGGIPMLLRWAGLPPGEDDADPAREVFYSDPGVRAFFQSGVAHLIDRVNTRTGIRYRDDPTILSWELLNESTVQTEAGAAVRRTWIAEMAAFIKARDPNHLVAAGLAGYRNRVERAEWIAVHQLPGVDYCDGHLYPEQDARVQAEGSLLDVVDDLAQLARFVVGKPLVIGELGFRTDDRRLWLGAARDAWFRRALERARTDGVAGVLAWIYQPWSGAARDFGIYTDRPDTNDVRAAMHALARSFASGAPADNPRLGTAVGDRLLYDPRVTVKGNGNGGHPARLPRARREGASRVVRIEPAGFDEARFEAAGFSTEGPLPHFHGAGFGLLSYRFLVPPDAATTPRRGVIRVRLSSEWPGFAVPATVPPASAGSQVSVLLDGARVGVVDAPPDDGAGQWRELTVSSRALRARLARPGVHTLAFEVAASDQAHGLCIYGSARASGSPVGSGPITLRLRD